MGFIAFTWVISSASISPFLLLSLLNLCHLFFLISLPTKSPVGFAVLGETWFYYSFLLFVPHIFSIFIHLFPLSFIFPFSNFLNWVRSSFYCYYISICIQGYNFSFYYCFYHILELWHVVLLISITCFLVNSQIIWKYVFLSCVIFYCFKLHFLLHFEDSEFSIYF